MRPVRTLILCLTVAAVGVEAVGAAVASGAPRAAARASRTPARMLVYAQEWSLWPSRTAAPAGRVIVQLWNRGQDAHDLQIRRLDARGHMIGRAQAVGVTQSGALREATWRLGAGRYELYCSMPGHLRRGMHTKFAVR